MPDSKYKILKDGWGTRKNLQGSHESNISPRDLEEGNVSVAKRQEPQVPEKQSRLPTRNIL